MTRSISILSNLLITLGLAGIGLALLGRPVPLPPGLDLPTLPATEALARRPGPAPPAGPATTVAEPGTAADAVVEAVPARTITHVLAPAADLNAPVGHAPFVPDASGGTWAVPEDRVGHAERTVGAGEPGNAVLFGHVSWKGRPGVFAQLHRLTPGDDVEVLSDDASYRYRVAAVGSTAPHDPAALQATIAPTLTLVTCDGLWLPHIWDYASRLVVHAELVSSSTRGEL